MEKKMIIGLGVRTMGAHVLEMLQDSNMGILLCNGVLKREYDGISSGTICNKDGSFVTQEITSVGGTHDESPLWFTSFNLDFGNTEHNFNDIIFRNERTGFFRCKSRNPKRVKWLTRRRMLKYCKGLLREPVIEGVKCETCEWECCSDSTEACVTCEQYSNWKAKQDNDNALKIYLSALYQLESIVNEDGVQLGFVAIKCGRG